MYYLRKFDMAGICVMICVSATPPVYYGFMCENSQFYGILFLAQIWLACLAALYVTMRPAQKNFGNNWIIAVAYLVAGYSTAPALIYLAYYIEEDQAPQTNIWPWLGGGILYAIGAILYAIKFPERYIRGVFDIYGSSHQLFHLFVLAAAFLQYWASIRSFHERQLFTCPESKGISFQ